MAIRFVTTAEPNRPPLGRNWLYVDEADDRLKLKKDDGSIVLFEGSSGSNLKIFTEYYTLNTDNIQSKQITLPRQPAAESSLVFIPSGGSAQIPGIDFTVTGSTITWENLGLDGTLSIDDKILITYSVADSAMFFGSDEFLLSDENILSKSVLLEHIPSSESGVILYPIGAPVQIPGIDFQLQGRTLTWAGLGLDGILERNDRLLVYYQWS